MGATPQLPRDDFSKYLRELERRLAIVEQRDPFANTGLSAPAVGTTQVDGNLVVQGNFTATGKVTNADLTDPVVVNVARCSITNFSIVASTLTEIAGVNITVPSGCTRLLAVADASIFAYNPNTTGGSNGSGGDAIYAQVVLNGQSSHADPLPLTGGGGFTTSKSSDHFSFTGLTPGSTIRLSVYGCSGYQAIAANTNNYARAGTSLTWLK